MFVFRALGSPPKGAAAAPYSRQHSSSSSCCEVPSTASLPAAPRSRPTHCSVQPYSHAPLNPRRQQFQQQPSRQHATCRALPKPSLYPKGASQLRVTLPALMVVLSASDVVDPAADVVEQVSRVVGAGATAVVLQDPDSGSASTLYEAAVKLKEALRGRAALLLVDRTDIVQAAEADGVLLTDKGVPVVVAKRMLSGGGGGLVGRIVTNAPAAVEAAADGANLVLVMATDGGPPDPAVLQAACQQQRSGNAIPVLLSAACAPQRLLQAWLGSDGGRGGEGVVGMDGLALSLDLLPVAAAAATGPTDGPRPTPTAAQSVRPVIERLAKGGAAGGSAGDSLARVVDSMVDSAPSSSGSSSVSNGSSNAGVSSSTSSRGGGATATVEVEVAGRTGWAQRLLSAEKGALLEEERVALARVLGFLREVVPDLPELVLLKDAVKQLDEPFLVVVVGEFNSGKSSVINSLLGKKFLAEGILPTTNEISILKYSDEEGAETRVVQQADGLYVKSFPSKLLEEMHIVDTPGTNVILERQQRLTEEYVPRADLVLFVMSVDRAFSESEVRFLDYIRQWRKKVVFVINKADMLTSPQEVEQVKSFVSNNAARVLKLDHPPVIAVSSRSAMRAKEAAMKSDPSGNGLTSDPALLAQNPDWESSGFAAFERLIFNFLVGTGSQHQGSAEDPVLSGTGEGVRLKLQTPLFVADALIGAAGQRLEAELSAAKADLAAVRMVSQQLARFRVEMEKDASAQRQLLQKVLSTATSRTDAFIDRTLALSNSSQLAAYITGGKAKENLTGKSLEKFEAEAVGTSFERFKEAVEEHSRWLVTNCEAQLSYYQSFVQQRIQEAESSGRPLPQRASAAPSAILSAASSNVLQIGGLNPPKPDASTSSPAAQGQLQLNTGDDEALSANPATISQATATAGDYVQQLTLARQKGLGSAALVWKTVEGFDMRAAVTLLDEEIREAVLGTATTAVGAPAAGLVATSIISNTLEDFLVMGMASLAAYASVLNLPLRRAEIKGKVAKLAGNFVEAVQGRMETQVNEAVDFSVKAIETAVAPLEEVTAEEVARLEALEAQRLVLIDAVRELQRRAANLE